MPYEFSEWEQEPEPLASSGRSGGPPRKSIGIGVLDPPVPPKRPIGPIPGISASVILRIIAGIILLGIAGMIFLMLFSAR